MKQQFLIFALFFAFAAYCQNEAIAIDNGVEKLGEQIAGEISQLTADIELHKNNPDASQLNKRGMLYFATKRYADAVTDFEKVIALDSSYLPDAYFYKALSNFMLGTTNCDDFKKAKNLGYTADWEKLKMVCPELE